MNKKIKFSKEAEEKLKKLEISELLQQEKWTFQDVVNFIEEAVEDGRLEKGIYKDDMIADSIRKAFKDKKRSIPKKYIVAINMMLEEKELEGEGTQNKISIVDKSKINTEISLGLREANKLNRLKFIGDMADAKKRFTLHCYKKSREYNTYNDYIDREEILHIEQEQELEGKKIKQIKSYLEQYKDDELQAIDEKLEILERINLNRHILDMYSVLAIAYYNNIDLIQLLPDIKEKKGYCELIQGFNEKEATQDNQLDIEELAKQLYNKVCQDFTDGFFSEQENNEENEPSNEQREADIIDMYKYINYMIKCDYEDLENILKLQYLLEEENDKYKRLVEVVNNIGELALDTEKGR